jgi:UDP-glucose 4-epimerase
MIIVTGATGFIGFYLVNELHNQNYSVLAVDKSGLDEAEYFKKQGIPFVQMDITHQEELAQLPTAKVEAVINLACVQPANVSSKAYDPAKYIEVNVVGLINILNFCNANRILKVLHTISHRNVQGLWEKGDIITENSPRSIKYAGKFSMFSISESAALDVLKYYQEEHKLQPIVFRLPSVYGYGHHENYYHHDRVEKTGLGVFIANASDGKDIEIWGDPNKGRDVVYVKDVVNAIITAIRKTGVSGLFNIASGKKLTLQQQVDDIIRVFSTGPSQSRIIYRPEKPNSIDPCVYDISKAQRELGWAPVYSFEDMLRDYRREMESGAWQFLINRKTRMAQVP